MKTAISLPDDLFELADEFARKTGRSRSEVYAQALREYLSRHAEDEVTERLNEVIREVEKGLPRDLRRATAQLLGREDW